MQKLMYLIDMIRKRILRQRMQCPSCECTESSLVQSKYIVTELRKCAKCKLLYRYPLDGIEDNRKFYETAYSQGVTTSMPSDEELRDLLEGEFRGHNKDFTGYLKILRALNISQGSKVVDFGCSWGYGSWQLRRAGYSVQGFEISRTRAEYARERLGVNIANSASEINAGADVFFSAHVLEHVPSVQDAILLAQRVLKPGGLFIAITPNGSDAMRSINPWSFKRYWGKVHPNYLSDEFYREAFLEKPLLLASNPYDYSEISQWRRSGSRELRLDGNELLAVAVPNPIQDVYP